MRNIHDCQRVWLITGAGRGLGSSHRQAVEAAGDAVVGRFGRIDILVNDAGDFFSGFFEELSPEHVRD